MVKYPEKVVTTVATETSEALDRIADENYTTRATVARRAIIEWLAAQSKDATSA